tara:strand:+ start:449 stop:1648 length:1200 start_codon:yes stop_codon:yes gene_type:complete
LSKKNILIISQYFPPDISGGGTRAYNYAKSLLNKGYNVTVVTAHPHLHEAVPKKYKFKLISKEKVDGINITRVWIPSLLHTSPINRIILHFTFLITCMIPLYSIKTDVIFASEPNLFAIIPAYFYSKLKNSDVIRVVDDLWPEAIYEIGYVKSGILKKILDKLAKFSYNYPKFILPLTEDIKNIIQEKYSIKKEKIIILEHGVDTKIFQYKQKERKENFVLMYSGSIVKQYDFDIIFEAAKKLQHKKIKFIIRGKGTLVSELINKKNQMNLKNIEIDTDLVPYEKISEALSIADVFLVPIKNKMTFNVGLPTKILEYQAIGRPIICCSEGAPGNYVQKTNSGIKVNHDDLDNFIKSILKLEQDEKLCRNMGHSSRNYVENNLTFEKIGEKLSKIVESLT